MQIPQPAACSVCVDGQGFYARQCPRCGKQKPLGGKQSLAYGLPVGAIIGRDPPPKKG